MNNQQKKRVKLIAGGLGLLVLTVALYFGIKDLLANTGLSQSEQNQGQVYYDFFTVIERYTLETGILPSSLDELKQGYEQLQGPTEDWPANGDKFATVVNPNFSITPASDNLEQFVPAYAERSFWARSHCEALWQLILKNCGFIP